MAREQTQNVGPSRAVIIIQILMACIALVGVAEATYLTVLALTGETAVCGDSTGCFQVLGSAYAKIGRVPVAALGIVAYFTVFSGATFAAFGSRRGRRLLTLTILLMFLFTLWLLGVQAFLLHAFCRYCLVSAAMVFLLTGLRVATPPSADHRS